MAKMHAGNNEERFVLASLKEFVKTWGSGRAGSFQLVCDEGHAKLSMEFSLETPGSAHFTPSDGNQDTLKRDKRRKNPSTLRRDKKPSELRRAQLAGPPGGEGALRDVQDNEQPDRAVAPDPHDPTARTETAESKKKKKKKVRNRGGTASATSNSSELQVVRASPKNCESTSSVPKEKIKNSSISGSEMSEGSSEEPLDPPVHWDSDTSLWDYVVEQGLSGRDPYRDLVALNKEIEAKTGPDSEVMREFWAALSLCITVFSRQDGLHLGFRRGVGSFGDEAPGGSIWTVEQVLILGVLLWEEKPRYFRDMLGEEITSLTAESTLVDTLCKKTGIRLRYKTLGPDSWDLVLT